jgi:hypothetical protein
LILSKSGRARLSKNLSFGLKAAALALATGSALAATALPARRAAVVDPMIALRDPESQHVITFGRRVTVQPSFSRAVVRLPAPF